MSRYWKKILITFVTVFLAVGACNKITEPAKMDTVETLNSSINTDQKTEIDKNETPISVSPSGCISPVETFAYSVFPESDESPSPINGTEVLPPSPWRIDTTILDETKYSKLMVARSLNGQVELWILVSPPANQSVENNSYEFTIYYPDTKTWKTISAEVGNSGVHIGKLFVTQDGSIFGHPFIDHYDNTLAISVLSKYNEETEEFEFVREAQTIPTSSTDSDGFHSSSKIILDNQGDTFWVLVPDDAIYSYNLITHESKKHVLLPDTDTSDLVVEPVFSPDGNIYFLLFEPNLFTNNNIGLYRFESATESIERIGIKLEPWPLASTIFADHSGRLWFGGVGWLEPDGTWYQMLRSPIFVTNVLWSGMEYRWKSPEILMESSDNRLWYESYDNGLVWLNPTTGEWCWFTTYRSNIVEDHDHNLWVIVDGKLYKDPSIP